MVNNDEFAIPAGNAPYGRKNIFRLMDLPAELRVYIYQFLLPSNKVLKVNVKSSCTIQRVHPITNKKEWTPRWELEIASDRTLAEPMASRQYVQQQQNGGPTVTNIKHPGTSSSKPIKKDIHTELFLVNKEILKEARAILYGSNTFEFQITSNPHFPISLQSPQIFGPFGTPEHLPLLRELRSIHLEVSISDTTHWIVKRQRARLEYFISVLKEHSDDADKKSLLEKLTVHLGPVQRRQTFSRCSMPHVPHITRSTLDNYMFGLDSLAELRGIVEIRVTGVPEWYARCLELCIRGEGGEVQRTEWPVVEKKKKKKAKKTARGQVKRSKGAKMISTRRWWQPVMNWMEFAEKNGLEMPVDVGEYWMIED